MNRKEIVKIFDLASFISVIIATCLVVLFEINGNSLELDLALVMYDATSLLLSVMFSIKLAFSMKPKENDDEIFKIDSKQKRILITKLVFSIIAFIFIMLVLVIF